MDPVFMGQFDFIRRMEPITQITDIEAIDLISDMLVVSLEFPGRDSLSIAILQGNSDRRLLSPFSLNVADEDGGGTDIPQRVLVGNFTNLLSSNDPREMLGHFLVSRGQITEDLLRIALSQQEQSRRPLGVTLVDMGVLTSEELVRRATCYPRSL